MGTRPHEVQLHLKNISKTNDFFFLNYYLYFSAMRQLYLKQGGSDPGILVQMADMEIEARGKKSKTKKSKGIFTFVRYFTPECKLQTYFFFFRNTLSGFIERLHFTHFSFRSKSQGAAFSTRT